MESGKARVSRFVSFLFLFPFFSSSSPSSSSSPLSNFFFRLPPFLPFSISRITISSFLSSNFLFRFPRTHFTKITRWLANYLISRSLISYPSTLRRRQLSWRRLTLYPPLTRPSIMGLPRENGTRRIVLKPIPTTHLQLLSDLSLPSPTPIHPTTTPTITTAITIPKQSQSRVFSQLTPMHQIRHLLHLMLQ